MLTILFVGLFTKAEDFNAVIQMKNGDIVSGTTAFTIFNIKTKYGTLQIPAKNVYEVSLGIATDYSQANTVNTQLKQLQMASENEAKSIYNQLLSKGTSILGIVKDFTNSTDYNFSESFTYTVDDLLEELYKKADMKYMSSTNDLLVFDDNNTVEGLVDINTILLNTDYGKLAIDRSKINSIEISYIDKTIGANTYKLFANKNITGNYDDEDNAWLKTSVEVKVGDQIMISATGKAKLESLSGGLYGPNGYVGGTTDEAYSDEDDIPYGTLVYKIGEEGEMIKAGSNYKGTADENGTIFIAIYETVYDNTNSGGYTVKVNKK